MKISIITVCKNSQSTIEDTIKSVLEQTYDNIEYIIIDGKSTDNTMQIINKYKDNISKIISSVDSGIYDAMNKGVKESSGDIVGILNSDDLYTNPNVLSDVVNNFKVHGCDAVYGDIIYVKRDNLNKKVRYWKSGEYKFKNLSNGWTIPHPTFFVRRNVYEKYGYFNLDFKIAADYELLLRFLKNKISVVYVPNVLVFMREGGMSASSLVNRLSGWREVRKAWKVNNLKLPHFLITKRLFKKITQYFL